jgi:hypothetical protein
MNAAISQSNLARSMIGGRELSMVIIVVSLTRADVGTCTDGYRGLSLTEEGPASASPSDLRRARFAFVCFFSKRLGGFFLLLFSLKLRPTDDLFSAQRSWCPMRTLQASVPSLIGSRSFPQPYKTLAVRTHARKTALSHMSRERAR